MAVVSTKHELAAVIRSGWLWPDVQIVKDKVPYERAVVTRDEALGMFQENKFKVGLSSHCPV